PRASATPAAPKAAPPAAVSAKPEPVAGSEPPAPSVPVPDDMLPVPAGTFTMGADGVGEPDEQPAHQVTLDAFWLDKTEVTNEQYRECVAAMVCRRYRDNVAKAMKYGSEAAFRGPKQPVVGVSWDDSKTYCEWRDKRLPTEAEFERAARGDDAR